MGSGTMIYIPSFIKHSSGIQKLIEGDTQTHRQQGDHISLLLLFQNKECRLINGTMNIVNEIKKKKKQGF
jgi:hypothetical protein